jgi:hypothetical protein
LPPQDRDQHWDLAVCSVFKNEARSMAEWLEFHRLVGVQKFILVDNGSDDDYEPILRPHIESGTVTLFHHSGRYRWREVYGGCLDAYRENVRWLAFLDLDEFLYGRDEDLLPDVLADYKDEAGLAVHWMMFGPSGHILRPEGLIIENYTRCQAGGNKHVKLVVNPARTECILGGHTARFLDGAVAVNERREPVLDATSKPAAVDRIRINHYWTRSVEDWIGKLDRGYNDSDMRTRPFDNILHAERTYGNGEDLAIQRFVPALKARLAQR